MNRTEKARSTCPSLSGREYYAEACCHSVTSAGRVSARRPGAAIADNSTERAVDVLC